MTISIYHNGFLLFRTQDQTKAWEKAQLYGEWFTSVEIRSEGREWK
jgi:hypothetical protein